MAAASATAPFVLDMAAIKARQATLNLGTLGNVSEGKSTFVRAISGIATQKHKKEKVFNITIHLGYAGFKIWRHLDTGDLKSTASNVDVVEGHELIAHYSFADCPGHEAYLATMLSGASIMDAAALVVASNSDTIPQIQTEEHLIAAEFMGLPHVFTLQNKLDLVESATPSLGKIKSFIRETVAERGPVIPLSAQRGWGIQHALHHLAYGILAPKREFEGPLKMMVVRSFDVNKPQAWLAGTSIVAGGVLGGTIQRGVLHRDDVLEIRPGFWDGTRVKPLLTSVKTLYSDATELPFAIAGGLIGVGTTLDPAFTSSNGLIGQVVGTPGTLPLITRRVKGTFRRFVRSNGAKLPKQVEGDAISFCVGITTVKGRITKILETKERVITLERPVCLEKGQICGILRSNGDRELLDGVLIVERVQEFDAVVPWSEEEAAIVAAEQAKVLARRYSVVEHDIHMDAEPLPAYEHMLDDIESLSAAETEAVRVRFPGPIVSVSGGRHKKTIWSNCVEFMGILRAHTPVLESTAGEAVPLEEHFQDFLTREFSTTMSVKGDGQYQINCKLSEHNIQRVIGKYLAAYHTCKQCGALEVTLVKEERIQKIVCSKCTAHSAIRV